jgi:hypothetical protein
MANSLIMNVPPVPIPNNDVVRDFPEPAQAPDERRRAVEDAIRRFQRAPVVGEMLTDRDLYNGDGYPI